MWTLELLDAALGQDLYHGATLELNFHANGHFQTHIAFTDFCDFTQHTTDGDHLIALGQRIDHRFMLFLFFHLRPDHHKIKHHKHQHQRQHAHERRLETVSYTHLRAHETRHDI